MSGQIRILSTRPLEGTVCEEAKGAGIVLDMLPFIETRSVQDDALGNRIRSLSRRPLIAVFTSVNGVEAVADWLDGIERKSAETIPWTIYCIGGATRQVIGKSFGESSIAGTADAAGALANLIVRDMAGRAGEQEVFFFCGDLRRDELPSALRRASIGVNELVVYTTRQVRHKVEQAYDGIVFFSPSAVDSFFSGNKVNAAVLLFAIGQTTADTIRKYCANETIVSPSPDKETLIRQVIDHYKQEHNL